MNNLTVDDYFVLIYLGVVILLVILYISSFILIIIGKQYRVIKFYRIIAFLVIPPMGVIYTVYRIIIWSLKRDYESGALKKRFQNGFNSFKMIFKYFGKLLKWLFTKS